jgi:hypothetical protein
MTTIFYSAAQNGFYTEADHGQRLVEIIDPAWVHPVVFIEDTAWVTSKYPGVAKPPMVEVPDPLAIPVMILVANPECRIPEDAVEIPDCKHAELVAAQQNGKRIVSGGDGYPAAVDPPVPSVFDLWDRIQEKRDFLTENGGYKVGAKWFHSDQKSRSQQLSLLLLGADIPLTLQWKTMDGTFVTMTEQLAQQILKAAIVSDQTIFTVAEAHRVAMESSADPASYDFSSGWPKVF